MNSEYADTIASFRTRLDSIKQALNEPYDDLEELRQALRDMSKEATVIAKGRPSSGPKKTRGPGRPKADTSVPQTPSMAAE